MTHPTFSRPRAAITSLTATCLLLAAGCLSHPRPPAAPPSPTATHTLRQIEGFTIRIDNRLLDGPAATIGREAIKLLTARLVAIAMIVPDKPLTDLRKVTIELDLNCGGLHSMQYHPAPDWLKAHGYSAQLAHCVHIPDARAFISPFENHRQPWAVMHELAHAYHDQVLGFNDPRIKSAYEKYRADPRHKSVLTVSSGMRPPYALTNEKEFFSEMTECYFGTNDFYPFVSGELQQSEPGIYALLREIWGPLPGTAGK